MQEPNTSAWHVYFNHQSHIVNMTLGGYICVRNGDSGDYCWREAATSLLPVVDELILCDSDSVDGTREAMDRLADSEPKIRVINYPWPAPKGDGKWWTTWLNFAREHLKTDFQITVDADEILSDHPDCHTAIRDALADGKPRTFNRLNFWKDASHLIPEGHAVGKHVVRFGPTSYWMPSDEGHRGGELPILDNSVRDPRLEIFHMGFLRRKDAFWRKAKVVLGAFFNTYDTRLVSLESAGKPLADVQDCEWTKDIVPWQGWMPNAAERWLAERGHNTNNYVGMNEQEAYKRVQTVQRTNPDEPLNVLVVGDLGDILHGMSIFKSIGKVKLFYRDANHICKRIVHRMPLLEPLLASQDYIVGVEEHKEQDIHWNAGEFRQHHQLTRSLAWAHWQHYQGQKSLPPIKPQFSQPWITGIQPDARSRGRIVIARSPRYHNSYFRWKQIVEHYNDRLLFVGLPEEHRRFVEQFGKVEYAPTKDLLEVAQLIAGSELFIGNQSAPMAVAEGMKHRRVYEMCPYQPDVVVALDEKVIHSGDGALQLPPLAGKPELSLPSGLLEINYLTQTNTVPRNGWSRLLPNFTNAPTFKHLHAQVQREMKMDADEAKRLILDRLAAVQPDYFNVAPTKAITEMVATAIRNAK